MEASKASTGNLSVVMEKCDAGVMLVQTVGEFEEKLMANQIELQVKKPEKLRQAFCYRNAKAASFGISGAVAAHEPFH